MISLGAIIRVKSDLALASSALEWSTPLKHSHRIIGIIAADGHGTPAVNGQPGGIGDIMK